MQLEPRILTPTLELQPSASEFRSNFKTTVLTLPAAHQLQMCMCVCVCVKDRERERDNFILVLDEDLLILH